MMRTRIGEQFFEWGTRTYVMGILNVTPDSFADGGWYTSVDNAVQYAVAMEQQGADIIDVGGESTRPGSVPVTDEEEWSRVEPVLTQLVRKLAVPVSIDTYKAVVAERALALGVSMVNDVSGLRFDPRMVEVVAEYKVPVCVMHMKGTPRNMQRNPTYTDVMQEICKFLEERRDFAVTYGIKPDRIIVDPGLGFGKRTGSGVEDNCEILLRLAELKTLGQPILVGPSLKMFIGNMYGTKGKPLPVSERLPGSLAAACLAIANGADLIRVHDVSETCALIDRVDHMVRTVQKEH